MASPRNILALCRPAFTLLELLVVIGILLILSTVTAISVTKVTRDAKVSGATNAIVSSLGIARSIAVRDNAYVMVTFRVTSDRRSRAVPRDPQTVQILIARWTGEVVSSRTPGASAISFPSDVLADRFIPVPGIPPRELPPGIMVAGPAFAFVLDQSVGANDRFWRTQPRFGGTQTPPDPVTGIPGFIPNLQQTELGWALGVLFGPDGRVLSRNPEQVLEVVSDSAAPDQNAWVKAFVDVDGNGLPSRGTTNLYGNGNPQNVDFFVYDEPLDESLIDYVPYLAVFNDSEAREVFPATVQQWKGTGAGSTGAGSNGNPPVRTLDQSRFIEERSDRIVFNRYSGIAGTVAR
jgi:prepilin-type N-terminal cleavage/methylation domain-containing protein